MGSKWWQCKSLLERNLENIMPDGRAMILAYDQGLEHGPEDFKPNPKSADFEYILDIAKKGGFTGLVVHWGLAEKYKRQILDSEVPLILKLNGKTRLYKGEPYSPRLHSVRSALSLGARAVGYTVYSGSRYEYKMNKEFSQIVEEAHGDDVGLPVIGWMYPRGKSVENDAAPETVAIGARAGLELGADIVKIKYTGDAATFRWVVECAGSTKVVMSGGTRTDTDEEFLAQVRGVMAAGGIGVAVGRNAWQRSDPLEISRKIREAIFK